MLIVWIDSLKYEVNLLVKSCSDLFHLAYDSQDTSMLSQMAIFHLFLWLSTINFFLKKSLWKYEFGGSIHYIYTRSIGKHKVGSSSWQNMAVFLPPVWFACDIGSERLKELPWWAAELARACSVSGELTLWVQGSERPLLDYSHSDVLTQRMEGGTPASCEHQPLTIHKESIVSSSSSSFMIFDSKRTRSGSCDPFILRLFFLLVFLWEPNLNPSLASDKSSPFVMIVRLTLMLTQFI